MSFERGRLITYTNLDEVDRLENLKGLYLEKANSQLRFVALNYGIFLAILPIILNGPSTLATMFTLAESVLGFVNGNNALKNMSESRKYSRLAQSAYTAAPKTTVLKVQGSRDIFGVVKR